MHSEPAQVLLTDAEGRRRIEGDWHPAPLPGNLVLGDRSYPDTSYSFTTSYSREDVAIRFGRATGNYGHGIFTTGVKGRIQVGDFTVLQCTRIIANRLVSIGDHCMFSWGSVVTDSWIGGGALSIEARRRMLDAVSRHPNRHLEFEEPMPVKIEDNVWVGFDAIVMPGVTIGRGSVIGCKSVVFEDIPPYSVAVGNPASVIRTLEKNDDETFRKKAVEAFLKNR